MAETVAAPFTAEQVEMLNAWQRSLYVHPFTCANRSDHPIDPEGDQGVLVATEAGWVCRHCDYTQTWAHKVMTEPIPEPPAELDVASAELLGRRVSEVLPTLDQQTEEGRDHA